ncbi:MAG: N-6 DNA methylase, partial [Planctomycetota bacterium]
MADFARAKTAVAELVERFKLNPPTSEAATRLEFIDPFFEALGWDVRNAAGHAEQYKDVVVEPSVMVGAATKAPDYAFRVGGVRKFFVEAKKPSVSVKGDPHPAYQLRRYAWSAKLPLSILTDFEEFAVYDCTKRPNDSDQASKARVLYFTSDDYAKKFREIWDTFAKDSILKGSFDRFKGTGTQEVDAEFLKEIENWRMVLARSIALRNAKLEADQLNEAVQRVIDRIIFLRMAEDRGIETRGRLLGLINANDIYKRFGKLCEQADAKYNSGIFDFKEDTWTLALKVDDKVLKPIIKGIYYPDSPYEFSVLSPEILGNVYEQFLGKVIRLTGGHQARVEEKPEVRKAGGVYYTPKYIVDYIVEHTVGELIKDYCGIAEEEASPRSTGILPVLESASDHGRDGRATKKRCTKRRSSPLPKHFHVLDPACGSGSFLLGAYQRLLDHCLEWYVAHNPEKRRKQVYRVRGTGIPARGEDRGTGIRGTGILPVLESGSDHGQDGRATGVRGTGILPVLESGSDHGQDGRATKHSQDGRATLQTEWRLTTAERKRILTEHIYGVDIDRQAVEVTKLSLLLKVLEGETADSLGRQMQLFRERALPNLSSNIKCGNSLIGPDYFDGRLPGAVDPAELRRVNPFDWEAEFPHVLGKNVPKARRGFDAVIGNPPYVRQESLVKAKEYLSEKYVAYESSADLFVYFFEKGTSLLRTGGRFSMIVSSSLMFAAYARPLRKYLVDKYRIWDIVDFGGLRVFVKAQDVSVCIPVVCGIKDTGPVRITKVPSLENPDLEAFRREVGYVVPSAQLQPDGWWLDSAERRSIFEKVRNQGVALGAFVSNRIFSGIKTGFNKAYVVDIRTRDRFVEQEPRCSDILRPFAAGQDIRRYRLRRTDKFIAAIRSGWTIDTMQAEGIGSPRNEKQAWTWFVENFQPIAQHLKGFEKNCRERQDQGEFWWELRSCDYYDVLDGPKIVYPDIAKWPRFFLDTERTYIGNTAYALATADKCLLGVLNSRMAWFCVSSVSIPFGIRAGQYRYRMIYQYMENLPLPDFGRSAPESRKNMVALVDATLAL